jgi:hypothetical protein
MIKFVTDKKFLYGRSVMINGTSVRVNNQGIIEVSEELAAYCPLAGFQSVDPDAKFESLDERKKAQQVGSLIATAQAQAEEIIKQAERKAEEIVKNARKEKESSDIVDKEKQEVSAKLVESTKEELIDTLVMMKIPKEDFRGLNKQQLIDLIIAKSYTEETV